MIRRSAASDSCCLYWVVYVYYLRRLDIRCCCVLLFRFRGKARPPPRAQWSPQKPTLSDKTLRDDSLLCVKRFCCCYMSWTIINPTLCVYVWERSPHLCVCVCVPLICLWNFSNLPKVPFYFNGRECFVSVKVRASHTGAKWLLVMADDSCARVLVIRINLEELRASLAAKWQRGVLGESALIPTVTKHCQSYCLAVWWELIYAELPYLLSPPQHNRSMGMCACSLNWHCKSKYRLCTSMVPAENIALFSPFVVSVMWLAENHFPSGIKSSRRWTLGKTHRIFFLAKIE